MTKNYKIGEIVNYTNGNPSVYRGEIVKVKPNTLVVIDTDDKAAAELYKRGYAVGTEIAFTQIK